MATISSIGIGSGLDINSIITQLIAVERVPLTQLQTEATAMQTKLSTYGRVQSSLTALRDAASALTKSDTWSQTVGTSSDASAVAVTTSTSTAAGQYAIQVSALASVQSNVSSTYASADSLVGEGTLHIQLGTWSGTAFNPKTGAAVLDISSGPPAQSLAQLRDTINASGAGVVASVVTDASGARLVFRSSASGASNGFRITTSDTDGNNSDGLGLSALAFDPSAGILSMARALSAANASATINGVPITSESNTLTNIVDGLNLTLNKITTVPVQVTAAADTSGIRKTIDSFVSAYNALNTLLAEQTKYDAGNSRRDNLQGDGAALAVRAQFRSLTGATSGASTTFTRLSDIGMDVQSDGSLKLNEAKVTSGIGNLAEIKKLFATSDIVTPGNNGLATRIRISADQVLGSDGSISTRMSSPHGAACRRYR